MMRRNKQIKVVLRLQGFSGFTLGPTLPVLGLHYCISLEFRFSGFCSVPLSSHQGPGSRFSTLCSIPRGSHQGPGSRFFQFIQGLTWALGPGFPVCFLIFISHENTIINKNFVDIRESKILQGRCIEPRLLFTGETSFSSRFFFNIREISAQIKKTD